MPQTSAARLAGLSEGLAWVSSCARRPAPQIAPWAGQAPGWPLRQAAALLGAVNMQIRGAMPQKRQLRVA
jgi:uncharacterized lipoprotein YbaY